jgi:hypothetical protein
VALEVQVHTLSETGFAENSLVHADDLGAFVVPARVAVSGGGCEGAWERSEGALAYTVLV